MNDKFIKDIKEKTNDLEIPESLRTENIIKKLENSKQKKKNKYKTFIKIGSVCAAGLLLVVGLTFAFNIEKEYAEKKALQKVATAESYKEIYSYFDGFLNGFLDGKTSSDDTLESLGDGTVVEDSTATEYSSTNIQVEGVDEGDTVKTDGKYIYGIDMINKAVRIFNTSGETITATSMTEIPYSSIQEIYVSDDKLVVICTNEDLTNSSTYILTYDITDRAAPVKIGEVSQDGYFTSSRMVDNIVYTFSNYYMYTVTREECVPTVNGESVEPGDVYLTSDIASPNYQVITSVDINSPNTIINNKTILGNYASFYVSNNNIYVASMNGAETQIMKLSYSNGIISGVATGSVKGYIYNTLSMDEYQGNLRVVTTTNSDIVMFEDDIATSIATVDGGTGSNSLYVLNESMEVIGSVENLAPGESIYSARFMGETGYFVTFERTDPLFAVDLSNPTSPTVLSELELTGFSEYLHFWSENLLLGIGQEADAQTGMTTGVKLSMFDISNPGNVTEINRLNLENYDYTPVGYNHRVAMVDMEKNLIGFYCEGYSNNLAEYKLNYLVYSYSDTEGFKLKIEEELGVDARSVYNEGISSYAINTRGLYINNYLYIVNPSAEISVYSLDNYSKIGEVTW